MKTPKAVTVILGLVVAGVQAVAELMKAWKSDNKHDDTERKDT